MIFVCSGFSGIATGRGKGPWSGSEERMGGWGEEEMVVGGCALRDECG